MAAPTILTAGRLWGSTEEMGEISQQVEVQKLKEQCIWHGIETKLIAG